MGQKLSRDEMVNLITMYYSADRANRVIAHDMVKKETYEFDDMYQLALILSVTVRLFMTTDADGDFDNISYNTDVLCAPVMSYEVGYLSRVFVILAGERHTTFQFVGNASPKKVAEWMIDDVYPVIMDGAKFRKCGSKIGWKDIKQISYRFRNIKSTENYF